MILKLALLAAVVTAHASPGEWAEQARRPRRPDPQAQLQEYYRQYPDRYIRPSKETWTYDEKTRIAVHSFTLTNGANATYYQMQVRFTYQAAKGKTLYTQTVPVEGALSPFRSMQIKGIKVKNVPAEAEMVVIKVEKATVYR